jgi:hypothetical protein
MRVRPPLLDVMSSRIDRQGQRPGWLVGARAPAIPAPARLLGVAATLVGVVAVGTLLVGGSGIGPGPTPTPTPTATPTAAPTPVILGTPQESLAPGTYAFINNGGRTTFTVPDGWSVPTPGGLDFAIAPVDAVGDDTVRIFYDMRIAARDDACSERPEAGIDATAAAIVASLAADPELDVSTPDAISLGGLDGLLVNVKLAPTATRACPFTDEVPAVPLLVDSVPGAGPFWGLTGFDARQRIIVLDHPAATNVVLLIDSVDGASFDDLVAASMPVLASFRFD